MWFYILLLKMAASLIALAATAAVVAGIHVPRITMEHFLLVTLTPLTRSLYKYVYTMRDYSSLVWYDYVVFVELNMQINEKVVSHVVRQIGSGTRARPC